MEKPIIVSYRWSLQEYDLLLRVHLRYSSPWQIIRRSLIGLGVTCILFSIPVTAIQRNSLVSWLPLLLLGAGFASAPYFMRRKMLKAYQQKPDRDQLITYDLAEDRLASRSEIASADFLWRAVHQVIRAPEGFLVYPVKNVIHWLPTSGFQNASDVQKFATFAQSHLRDYQSKVKGDPT